MQKKARIASIAKASNLDLGLVGIESFSLSKLELDRDLDFPLPGNIRLGHLAERIVAELIKASANYSVLYENVQLIEDKKTIGEIDFILTELETKRIIHLELAYKFYLFDPSIPGEAIGKWIGPNRKDSLIEKLDKLKEKQFPLLYHDCAKSTLNTIPIREASQALCMLVSLFVPYHSKVSFEPRYARAIKGYYLYHETFINLDHTNKVYCLPPKKEWGIDPSENEDWMDFELIKKSIESSVKERQSRLCWQKQGDSYSGFFIVWW